MGFVVGEAEEVLWLKKAGDGKRNDDMIK